MKNTMRIQNLMAILFLTLASVAFGQKATDESRTYGRTFRVYLVNLESASLSSAALQESPDSTMNSLVQGYLADHKKELEQLFSECLGSEFSNYQLIVGEMLRGRATIPFPEKKGELVAGFGVTRVGTSGNSSDLSLMSEVWLTMLLRPAASVADLRKFETRFREVLKKELPEYSREFLKKRLDAKKNAFQREYDEAAEKADSLQGQLGKLRSREVMPADKAAEQLIEIDRQLLSARLATAGLEARERSIVDHIARLEKQDLSDSDKAMLANLEKIYDLRQENVKRLKAVQSGGTTNVAEQLQKAETDVLAARMEYEKAKAAARGAERQAVLNAELTKVSIDRAEAMARLEYLEKARKETAESIQVQREIEKITAQLNRESSVVKNAITGLEAIKTAPEKIDPVEVVINRSGDSS